MTLKKTKTTLTILFFCALIFTLTIPLLGKANNNESDGFILFFWSHGCPYCSTQKVFLEDLAKQYPQVEIKQYEFSKNINLIKELYQKYEVPSQKQGYVPITFTADSYFIGFNEEIAQAIEKCIQECLTQERIPTISASQKIKIPFFGEINIEKFSLPVLAVILGTLDGFNVCSLGALVLILGLVLTLKSKRKILIFGGIFVLTTVIVYGILVFLWHQLFVFIAPQIKKMGILIGLLALVGAIYFFREFLKIRKGGVVCQFGGISDKFAQKIQKIFEKKASIFVLTGAVLLFAALVTIIEFPCTAFFPVLFAGILADAAIPFYLSLSYIGLYIFFYMIDEIIVLLVAAFTMKIWIASPKFITVLNFIASILLFLLSLYYFLPIFH